MGHLMMENRNSLIVDARLTEANGTAERATALGVIKDNVGRGSTVVGTRTLTPPILSPAVANSAARRMSRRTTAIAVQQSMPARHAILATASAR
jgi:hypothetical protein